MPWEVCKRFTSCQLCGKIMIKGDKRFSWQEKGKQDYWKITRHICESCAKSIGDFESNISSRFKQAKENLEQKNGDGVLKRRLRPIDEMKGEQNG